MRIGILGSGNVAQSLASGLSRNNHEVMMGTRDVNKLKEFQDKHPDIKVNSFSDTSRFGEVIFLCTEGIFTENAINLAGKDNFNDKVLVDVTNPLDTTKGMPPRIAIPFTYPNSLGLHIQNILPKAKVVKAFNTVTSKLMVNPGFYKEKPSLFICGDETGKETVIFIAKQLGWEDIIDLGDISHSSLLESLTILWVVYGSKKNYWNHAFKLLKE